jgi:hypothetical protein
MPLATERHTGRRVVIAEASLGNNYGVLTAYTAGLEAEFRDRGWAVTMARAAEPGFLATLLQHGTDTDAVGLLGHFFYDLRVSAQNHFNAARIGDLFRGRLSAMWADHPFTGFMWPRLQDADPRAVYFPADPGFIAAAALINPQLKRFHPLALPVLYADRGAQLPLAQRQIDVLLPLTFRDIGTREQTLAELAPDPRRLRLAEALFSGLHDDRTTYPFTAFLTTLQAEFGISAAELGNDRKLLHGWLGVLSKVDLIIRNERRITLTLDLLRDVAGLRVHLVGKLPPGMALPPEVVREGPLDAYELGRRMAQSRWVVHCHPTYPQAMHERVLTAMASGCGVISDFAPILDQTFEQGRHWLHARPGASLRELLAGIDAARLASLGAAALQAVEGRYGMAQHVDELLTGVETLGAR